MFLAVSLLVNCDMTPISHLPYKKNSPDGSHEKEIFSPDYLKENIEQFFINDTRGRGNSRCLKFVFTPNILSSSGTLLTVILY